MAVKDLGLSVGAAGIPDSFLTPDAIPNDEHTVMSDDKENNSAWQTILAYLVTTQHTTNPVTNVTGKTTKEQTMNSIAILALISAILPLVKKCREDSNPTDEELVASARGVRGVFAIRRAARANGLRGRRFRTTVREAIGEMKNMSDDDLLEQVINAPEMEEDEDGNDGLDYDLF